MNLQSFRSLYQDSFRTLPWESRDKQPFECRCVEKRKKYYMGEGDGFPGVRAVVSFMSLVNLRSPVVCPNTKGVPENELIYLLVGLMQVQVSN